MAELEVIEQPQAMRQWAQAERRAGRRIVLVPTMGYLHPGHLALVKEAHAHGDRVVVSIFVNPTQFGANEDLDRYPKDEHGDLRRLRELGVHAAFTPARSSVYPEGFDTYVVPEGLSRSLCGASRPGHFRGVTTVVTLLLRITLCHTAVFGEKDFQQLQIIRRMVSDLWLDVQVVGVPIVREPDGLAMSSRNAYLNVSERQQALALSRALSQAEAAVAQGERRAKPLLEATRQILGREPNLRIDYAELLNPETLQPVTRLDQDTVLALAAFVGNTRLIDNRRMVVSVSQAQNP